MGERSRVDSCLLQSGRRIYNQSILDSNRLVKSQGCLPALHGFGPWALNSQLTGLYNGDRNPLSDLSESVGGDSLCSD